MKILFAVWELDPFLKFGGLGDVARSFPGALKENGIDVKIILPFYQTLKLRRSKKTKLGDFKLNYAGKKETIALYTVLHPYTKVPVYLLKNKKYLDVAAFPDTYAFFNKAIVEILARDFFKWMPDIIHCNDLHTSLIPLLVKEKKLPIKTLLTIHNLSYQGKTSTEVLERLGIEDSRCRVVKWEIKSKQINFLLEGICHADVITTVSPTYAREILKEEFGNGLDDVLVGRQGRIFGILNGIDINWREVMHNRWVKYPYVQNNGVDSEQNIKLYSWEEGKKLNKQFLQRKLNLKRDSSLPMLSFIGRFDARQKGLYILHKMLRTVDITKYQFVILGTGDVEWEERFTWLSTFFPKHVSCNFKFDEDLAHQIYAASDFMIIPSSFEPCGLIQMIAMYFGTLPIVNKTGGLADSVTNNHNGFVFNSHSSQVLTMVVEKAVDIWKNHRSDYRQMVENAFQTDFSWRRSAKEYINLYDKLINNTF